MGEDMRKFKFETLMGEVSEASFELSSICSGPEIVSRVGWADEYSYPCLSFIYDYETLNDYGKVIMDQSARNFSVSNYDNVKIDSMKNIEIKIVQAKKFLNFLDFEEHRPIAYKFIFWAIMVLTVDKTDKDEHLSLICDFARMLKITDVEMMDIVKVIKVIYHEEEKGFKFETQTIPSYFSSVLNLYN